MKQLTSAAHGVSLCKDAGAPLRMTAQRAILDFLQLNTSQNKLT
jgi:hypothetical protein